MKIKLFGTDGIRGRANQPPILPNTIVRVGQALGALLNKKENLNKSKKTNLQNQLYYKKKQHVLIGKDTRLSGYMIEMALASGLNSMGVHVLLVGPLPTPGIGFLARDMRAKAGIVISASHNQYYDNGIKIFNEDGFKISKQTEQQIENMLANGSIEDFVVPSEKIGRSKRIDDAGGRYILHVKNHFLSNETLDGVRIVLDCANGACYKVAPRILEELGAEVVVIHNQPDGFNINEECGACYPEKIAIAVKKYRADLGISLDGDGDRVVMVDDLGRIVNGDHILGILALYAKETHHLRNNTVVITEMSNLGLERFLCDHNIQIIKAEVGDRHIAEKMHTSDCYLGGEPSGHILFSENATTGDGLIAALNILNVIKAKNKKLSDLRLFEDAPQILYNLHVSKRKELKAIKGYQDLIQSIKKQMGSDGRVFIRFSGTEPVVRILLQGLSQEKLQAYAHQIADCLRQELGTHKITNHKS